MIRGATWSAVLIVLSTTGCDLLFQLDHVERTDAGASDGDEADVAPDVLPPGPPLCASPVLRDDFDTNACATWGQLFQSNAGSAIGGGLLVLTPNPNVQSYVGCLSSAPYPFRAGGIALRVAAIARGATTYNFLQVHAGVDLQVGATGDGATRFQTGPGQDVGEQVVFAAGWWRVRPVAPDHVIGEVSPDGLTWTTLGVVPFTPPQNVTFEINAGGNDSPSVTGSAVYDELRVCP